MILFVFEGPQDKKIFSSLQRLFFPKETETFVCVYNSNIYSLYSKIKEYDIIGSLEEIDTLSVLNEILLSQKDETLKDIRPVQVSEIYLFFDYDFQEKRYTLGENNLHLKEMLDYFDDETGQGKLYINYPMLESIRYTKELPDADYFNYSVLRRQCSRFKEMTSKFSFYGSFEHLVIPEKTDEKKVELIKQNWRYLIDMNVTKANHLCHDKAEMPTKKSDIAQPIIFDAQLEKFVNTEECSVSILNSFPIFLYEYLNIP